VVEFADEVAGVVREDSDIDVVLLTTMMAHMAMDTTSLVKQCVMVDDEDADNGFAT